MTQQRLEERFKTSDKYHIGFTTPLYSYPIYPIEDEGRYQMEPHSVERNAENILAIFIKALVKTTIQWYESQQKPSS